MKNAIQLKTILMKAGIIALAAVIGFGIVSCDNGSAEEEKKGGGDAFTGTWIAQLDGGEEMKLTAGNGAFNAYSNNNPAYKGTYTVSGNTVSITFTYVNMGLFGWDGTGSAPPVNWTPYENVPPGTDGLPPAKTMDGTISGNQFNIMDVSFTKGGSSNPTPGPNNPADSQKLTITGLNGYDKKFVTAISQAENTLPYLFAANTLPPSLNGIEAGEIRNGSVTLKVWSKNSGSFGTYTGSDQNVVLAVKIFNYKTLASIDDQPAWTRTVTVNFTNGAGSAQAASITGM
jgi:hypothetical protein